MRNDLRRFATYADGRKRGEQRPSDRSSAPVALAICRASVGRPATVRRCRVWPRRKLLPSRGATEPVEKPEGRYLRCHRVFLSPSYCGLRISIILASSLIAARCFSIPAFNSSVVPLNTLCPPASSLRRTSASRRWRRRQPQSGFAWSRHGLAAEDSRQPLDFKFGITEFARGLDVGQRGGTGWVDDGQKARLSGLNGRGRRRQ